MVVHSYLFFIFHFRSFFDLVDSDRHLVVIRGSAPYDDLATSPPGSGKRQMLEYMEGRHGENIFVTRASLKKSLLGDPRLHLSLSDIL